MPAIDSDRWMSVKRLDLFGDSDDAATSVVRASRAPAVMNSAVEVPAADSDRCTSSASDLTCSAASDEAVTSVVWASRAPAMIDSAVEVPAVDSDAFDIDGQRLDVVGGLRRGV